MLITLKLQSTGLLPVQVPLTKILPTGSVLELMIEKQERILQKHGTKTLNKYGHLAPLTMPKTPSAVIAYPTTLNK